MDVRATRVRTWTLRLPLPTPLALGRMAVGEREYVFVRVDDEREGAPGAAWSLTRGLPIAESVDRMLAGAALETPLAETARFWQTALAAAGPAGQSGTAMRALSLLDVCLWDLKARALELPLHRLLGGLRDEVSVMAVSAYPLAGLRPEQAGERLRELLAAGHELVKLARWPDPADTAAVIAAAAAPPGRLVVDAAWAWDDAAAALAELRRWGEVELAWLEDPIAAAKTEAYRRLRERCPLPLAIGDEVSDLQLLDRLARDGIADVLRLDATVAGGITGVLRVLDSCWLAGVPASLHVGLPIHLQLAAAHPACDCVESFVGADRALDPVEDLLLATPRIERGRARVPAGPGLGVEVDWEQIEARAHFHTDSRTRPEETR
jgi:L-alanine-DL-glutamate epimerase-like enolase superfamily enzyme